MQSSVGSRNLQLRLQLWLAAVALSALALSLGLAFAAATVPRPAGNTHETPANVSIAAPVMRSTLAPPPAVMIEQSPPLWTLLERWAYAVDAIALLGVVAVLVVRRNTRRRRGTETEPRWP